MVTTSICVQNAVGPLAYVDYDGTRAHVRHCRLKYIAEHLLFRTVSGFCHLYATHY